MTAHLTKTLTDLAKTLKEGAAELHASELSQARATGRATLAHRVAAALVAGVAWSAAQADSLAKHAGEIDDATYPWAVEHALRSAEKVGAIAPESIEKWLTLPPEKHSSGGVVDSGPLPQSEYGGSEMMEVIANDPRIRTEYLLRHATILREKEVREANENAAKATEKAATVLKEAEKDKVLAWIVRTWGDEFQVAAFGDGMLRSAEIIDLATKHLLENPLTAAEVKRAAIKEDLMEANEVVKSMDKVSSAAHRTYKKIESLLFMTITALHGHAGGSPFPARVSYDLERLTWGYSGKGWTVEIEVQVGPVTLHQRALLAID